MKLAFADLAWRFLLRMETYRSLIVSFDNWVPFYNPRSSATIIRKLGRFDILVLKSCGRRVQ